MTNQELKDRVRAKVAEKRRMTESDALDRLRDYYGVPAYAGAKVEVFGRIGTIVSAMGNLFIGVVFDDDEEKTVKRCHPVWRVEYLS